MVLTFFIKRLKGVLSSSIWLKINIQKKIILETLFSKLLRTQVKNYKFQIQKNILTTGLRYFK